MRFDILTIFPKIFDSYINESILKRAQEKGLLKIVPHNLRDYSTDRHQKVDDSPYGGGPGMVFKFEPIYRAVEGAKRKARSAKRRRVILFSTRGKKLDAKIAKRLSKYDQLILICGRYEGVDERVAEYIADEEISIGDFVLAGGELPAMVLTETVARFIPGVLGKYESLEEVKGSYPVYTRPEIIKLKATNLPAGRQGSKLKALRVPKELLTGNHKIIEAWRKKFPK